MIQVGVFNAEATIGGQAAEERRGGFDWRIVATNGMAQLGRFEDAITVGVPRLKEASNRAMVGTKALTHAFHHLALGHIIQVH